jgi:hypothetical protein
MVGPYAVRPTVFTDREKLDGLEANQVEQWQTEELVNGASVVDQSHELVLAREAQKLLGIGLKGSVG